jgi:hypothetical protein
MKRFLFPFGTLVLIGLAAFTYYLHTRTAPAIRVVLQDKVGGSADYLPAVHGYASGHGSSSAGDGAREIYHVDETYKVISTAEGHFAVTAHYVIERDGILTAVDRTLTVWDKLPDQTNWSKLDNHLVAYAYLSAGRINY